MADFRDNRERQRYELSIEGNLAAFEDYSLEGESTISLNHTEAVPEFQGKGAARELVERIFEDARARGLSVLPRCPYVARMIRKHPDRYLDLVPVARRAEFDLPA